VERCGSSASVPEDGRLTVWCRGGCAPAR
jgi:hypothetical protein